MISRSAARRLTWDAAPPCWSQTTALSSASRLHLLPLGRVALHLITVGGSWLHLAEKMHPMSHVGCRSSHGSGWLCANR
jgi:hypothetical protein